jgi:hypothetical protein
VSPRTVESIPTQIAQCHVFVELKDAEECLPCSHHEILAEAEEEPRRGFGLRDTRPRATLRGAVSPSFL